MTAHLLGPANQHTSRCLPRDVEQAPSPAASTYTLGSNQAEQERLRRQSAELHVHSLALLEKVDLQAGHSAIDIGCGPCGVLELLSEPVGPSGRVIGLDFDATHVASPARSQTSAG
jgi:cyclopropane fatty-acyl-phospholipid synthase-like methyltransferase